jgi:PAS domain S-box-containing protein
VIGDDQIRAFGDVASEPYLEQDAEGVITAWNDEAARLFGWAASEAVGMRSHCLVPERNRDLNDRNIRDLIAAPRPPSAPADYRLHRNGPKFRVDVVLAVVERERGRTVGGFARKLTEPLRDKDAFAGVRERYRHPRPDP